MPRNLPLAFFEMLGGGLLVLTGLSQSDSLSDTLNGQFQFGLGSVGSSSGSSSNSNSTATINSQGETNPVPGATGSRLDQGYDVTGSKFVSPFAGTVVYSNPSDPGWKNGGVVAIANKNDPSNVIYFAEGLVPTVKVNEAVSPGQVIANPIANPYNGIVGNIEFGPANPQSPGQPLAQVVSNPVQTVEHFYNWVKGLGGPTASSTSNAGYR